MLSHKKCKRVFEYRAIKDRGDVFYLYAKCSPCGLGLLNEPTRDCDSVVDDSADVVVGVVAAALT